jgi:hypothetical protein
LNIVALARAAQEQRRRELAIALGAQPPQPASEARLPGRPGSFDGGARQAPPLPGPSHDQWLGEVLRNRYADVRASF